MTINLKPPCPVAKNNNHTAVEQCYLESRLPSVHRRDAALAEGAPNGPGHLPGPVRLDRFCHTPWKTISSGTSTDRPSSIQLVETVPSMHRSTYSQQPHEPTTLARFQLAKFSYTTLSINHRGPLTWSHVFGNGDLFGVFESYAALSFTRVLFRVVHNGWETLVSWNPYNMHIYISLLIPNERRK